MRTMNLDPFWRTSIGFDRLFDLMDESLRFEPEDHYPPCNIVRTGENTYRISLAVAGFKPEQVSATVNQNVLIVSAAVLYFIMLFLFKEFSREDINLLKKAVRIPKFEAFPFG